MRLIVGAALVALALVVLGEVRTSAAASDLPRNFVDALHCGSDASAQAEFLIPGTQASAEILAPRGVSGTAGSVWIDLSLFDNGFAAGTFVGAGPFVPADSTPGTRVFVWQRLLTSRMHYYRLNAHVGNTWVELGRGRFETPDCVNLIGMTCPAGSAVNAVNAHFLKLAEAPSGPGVSQWIDLSLFDNGFAPETFIGAGPFAFVPDRDFIWEGIRGATRHYYRLNVLYGDGQWRPYAVERGTFLSLDCSALPRVVFGG